MSGYTFKENLELEQAAIDVVVGHLKSQPYTRKVDDARKWKNYQKVDIDLVWWKEKDGRRWAITCEVKGDDQTTGCFFLETIANVELFTLGCILYTEARLLFYYFRCADELFEFEVEKLRPWLLLHMDDYPDVETETLNRAGRVAYKTRGKSVPIKTLIDAEIARVVVR
jgi:hypothetical protein